MGETCYMNLIRRNKYDKSVYTKGKGQFYGWTITFCLGCVTIIPLSVKSLLQLEGDDDFFRFLKTASISA